MRPIYKPSGAAKEYGDYAINIYTGCPHRCYYCFSPKVLRKDKEQFHCIVHPRENIVEAVKDQIAREKMTGKLVHLCFSCDPYPTGCDTTPTRQIILALKNSGNHVQILTKAGAEVTHDFGLLDKDDWFGITYAGYPSGSIFSPQPTEPSAGLVSERILALKTAKLQGISTWVSCEPVLDGPDVCTFIELADYVDMWKIGKLNYYPSNIDWNDFGHHVEAACISNHRNYYIKESLRKEMR